MSENNTTEKVFRDTRTQIGILRSRGMTIKNKKFAKRILRETNYYNLINGYKTAFIKQSKPYEVYLPGTRFEELYALFEFDRKLRNLTLEYILEIEKNVKSIISYCFSEAHGHRDYLNCENFDISNPGKFQKVAILLSSLYSKISSNIDKDPAVTHYVRGKNYLPLWVLVNAISMGDISKFYANMLQKDQQNVSKRIKWGLRENELSSCLFFLSTIRNRCAHDELLYCYRSYINLVNNKCSRYFHKVDRNDYFAAMIAFKVILSPYKYAQYQKEFEILLNELSGQLSTVSPQKIRAMMGLPNNWKRLKTLI